MNRRDFLATVPLTLTAEVLRVPPVRTSKATLQSPETAAPAADATAVSASHDVAFASALRAAEAIRSKQISSVELTQLIFERIDRYNPQLNAFAFSSAKKLSPKRERQTRLSLAGSPLGFFTVFLFT